MTLLYIQTSWHWWQMGFWITFKGYSRFTKFYFQVDGMMDTRLKLEWMFEHWVQGLEFRHKVEGCMCECIFHYGMFCFFVYHSYINIIGWYKYFVLQWPRFLWLGFKSPIKCLELEACKKKSTCNCHMLSNCITKLFVGSLKLIVQTCVELTPIHIDVQVGAT
jgi:hypothetical protein